MPNEGTQGGTPARNKRRIIRYLLAIALVTSLISSATLAKYSSKFTGTASMQVAAFAADGTADFTVDIEGISPGSTAAHTIQFAVQNYEGEKNSDVQLNYQIEVGTTGNLPLAFTLLGQTGEIADDNQPVGALVKNGDKLTATGGKLPIASVGGKKQHLYQLAVTWADDGSGMDYSHEIDMVTVTVTTEQAPTT